MILRLIPKRPTGKAEPHLDNSWDNDFSACRIDTAGSTNHDQVQLLKDEFLDLHKGSGMEEPPAFLKSQRRSSTGDGRHMILEHD